MLAAMTPEERELYEAEKEYERSVKQAERELAWKTTKHKAKVWAAEGALKKAREQGRDHLGTYWSKSYKKVDLWRDRIEVPLPDGSKKEHHFENGSVMATVDTAGNLAVTKTGTLTRWLAYGDTGASLFKKTKKHDTRELYLMIEGPDFVSLVECKPDEGPRVREFAAKINNASKSAHLVSQAREEAIAQAERELEVARKDRSEIEAATKKLEDTKGRTERLDTARMKVEEPPPDTP